MTIQFWHTGRIDADAEMQDREGDGAPQGDGVGAGSMEGDLQGDVLELELVYLELVYVELEELVSCPMPRVPRVPPS